MLDFVRNKNKIYIYGCGMKSKLIYKCLQANGVKILGFIISDNQIKPDKHQINVYYLSEIQENDISIIMGISYCHFNEVFPEILKKNISDIYFFRGRDNYKLLQEYDTWFSESHEYESEVYLNEKFSYCMSYKIFEYLRKSGLEFNTAVDVGGGSGAWAKAIKDLNNSRILVIDGNDYDRSALLEKCEYQKIDLSDYSAEKLIAEKGRFDIALSIEVAEHLYEKNADEFINNLCNLSDVILFSAAIEYQGGSHHVNEHFQSYWKEKFETHKYKPIDCIRYAFWNDTDIDCVVRQNCFLYVCEDKYEMISSLFPESNMPMDIVHPEMFIAKMTSLQEGYF